MNKIELIKGDCLEKMKDIDDKSIDMILCDLPYEKTACEWDSLIPFEPLWKQYERIIKDNGAIVLFGSQPFTSALIMSNLKLFKYDLIWDKEQGTNQFLKNYQPLRKHEEVLVFYKNQPTYNPIMIEAWRREIKIRQETNNEIVGIESKIKTNYDNEGLKYPTSMLPFNRTHWREGRFHPTQKPTLLLEYLIKTYTDENELVLDNTFGSCSCGIACMKTNRNFNGIEKDLNYFNIGVNRVKENLKEGYELIIK